LRKNITNESINKVSKNVDTYARKKVDKNKQKKTKIIIYLVAFLIVIYIIYTIIMLLKQPTNKVTVESGTLYLEEADVGYIIRNEQVVKGNNYKNGMEKIKNEGEKTAKGDSIYRYYSKNEEKLKEQISELDGKIQETLKKQQDLAYPSDAKIIENQIDEIVALLNQATDMAKITEYKKKIDELTTKKAKISGEASPSGSYLKQLYNQRTTLEKELNSGAEYIKAPISGIVSYKVDGLEETLTPNNFSAINKEFLENLNLKTGQLVATSDECGKIIDATNCYIATITNTEEAKKAKVGDNVNVRLSNNKTIDAKINYVLPENDEDTLIILEIDKQISELANYRKISFDLIWWSSTGLKVPNEAIVQENNLNYVVRNRAGYFDKILVNVERTNGKYSIVTNYTTDELKNLGYSSTDIQKMNKITIYDELLLNPDLSKIGK